MKYEVRIRTNYNTGDYYRFFIEAKDYDAAQEKAIKETVERGYDHNDLIDAYEIDECKNCNELILIDQSIQFEDPESDEIWCFCDKRCQEQYLTSIENI